jgi:uncharacterized protein (TIGR03067 family)
MTLAAAAEWRAKHRYPLAGGRPSSTHLCRQFVRENIRDVNMASSGTVCDGLLPSTEQQDGKNRGIKARTIAYEVFVVVLLSALGRSAYCGETLDLLVGDAWKCVAVEAGGNKATEEDGQRWTFTREMITWEDENGRHEVEYRINEAASPITLDWWDAERGLWHGRCILRCDGRTLQVCGRVGLKREKLERPKEFTTKGGDHFLRMVYFTRVK